MVGFILVVATSSFFASVKHPSSFLHYVLTRAGTGGPRRRARNPPEDTPQRRPPTMPLSNPGDFSCRPRLWLSRHRYLPFRRSRTCNLRRRVDAAASHRRFRRREIIRVMFYLNFPRPGHFVLREASNFSRCRAPTIRERKVPRV